jgi:WD40 repeat protein/mono/diheme cytochrome c family protein
MLIRRSISLLVFLALARIPALAEENPAESAAEPGAAVSYYQQVLPIFQAHCQGCHQPAKANGKYVMTSFETLLKGGESGEKAIVPGEPDESYLIEQITPEDGESLMPPDKPPLADDQIALIRRWIEQGARDDTPENARRKVDMDHPPVYTRPPVIPSLDFSPDGAILAVAGFHEVVLVKADGSEQLARLVGMAERIESVRFAPDGARLVVAGGLPCRMGEIQIWDVAKRKLLLSLPATYDTVYGASWSPDGALIAFGAADKGVRAIDAKTGEQAAFMAAHEDWVRGTVFSPDGKSVFSASRDMTVKMTDIESQRFVGNVTTHTPGVLKGGQQAIDRHPKRAEILVGGADGAAKLFKMDVQAAPAGGGNPNQLRQYEAMTGRVFDVRFNLDGTQVFVCTSLDGQGQVRSYETDSGNVLWTLDVPESAVYALACSPDGATLAAAGADGQIRLIEASNGQLRRSFLPVQVTASPSWPAQPGQDAGRRSSVPGEIASPADHQSDFIRDVNPILTRLGCNQGTCHGADKGRNGFKLSLRGYDALFDIRALTDDLASRRVNTASPDDSLILLKATGAAPHQGGRLIDPDSSYYHILRRWIADGARLDLSSPRVVKIDVLPQNPVVQRSGDTQPMQVTASYADGATRDVTREAFIESGDAEVATADRTGLLTAVRRGEAPVLARYEGAYAATTLTVMGDRDGFVWQQPETWSKIDELVAAKWQRMKILPSEPCGDAEFIRRVYLDLTGVPPGADQVRAFLADERPTRTKRNELIDRLLGSEDYVEYWTNKWADLLQVNRKFLGPEGAAAFRAWIRNEVASNTPYDEFTAKILTASGSNRNNPAASYFKILRDPLDTMENTTHLFLGVRFNCNKCHDHPFERWTQDQYYETAAFFARLELKPDPASGDRKIGGSAVEDAKPLYEIVSDKSQGEVLHDRTGAVAPPQFPYPTKYEVPAEATRRQEWSAWLTSPDNPYFARSYVNRLWGYLLGTGLIEPLDDIRAGNPPSNPELLDYLTQDFIRHGFNVQHTLREICQSRTYQLSIATNPWNVDDKINFSHAIVRRLPAEVLYDTIFRATGAVSRIPGVPPGTRAAALPDAGVNSPDGFLTNLGRPARESACECERDNSLQLGPVMALISGPTVDSAISDPDNALAKLAASEMDDAALVEEIFFRLLNRPATPHEIEGTLGLLRALPERHQQLAARLQAVEEEFAPALAEQEQRRQDAMANAQGQLEAYEKEIAAREAELDRQHAQRLADAQAALKDHEARVPERLAAWEQQVRQPTAWTPLDPIELSSTNNAQLDKQPDLSVVASGPNGKTTYQFVARTDLAGVTGVRLETLADERFPMKGPGRSGSGNFVLTEFRVEWAAEGEPNNRSAVELQNAQADFSQGSYDVTTAIDGQKAPTNNGWAVHPQVGQNHTAVFETKDNVGSGPAQFTFWLDQEYQDNQHTLGRFRISLTTAARPITLQGLPQNINDLLAVAAERRTDAQKAELLTYYRGQDSELKNREQALATAQQPRPVDPKLQALRGTLAEVSKPVPLDAKLAQLRADTALSAKQLETARLTFVQDLAWALINSPAFLFNR